MAAPDDQYEDMPFPLQGISLTHGFAMQLPQTTRTGVNVRAYEPGTNRARGGSRPGIAKYIMGQIPTAGKIQHLNYVVDPSADALLANFDVDPTDNITGLPAIDDPSTNPPGSNPADPTDFNVRNRGRVWRNGGSGIQPNRNIKNKRKTTNSITFVQSASDRASNNLLTTGATVTIPFLSPVTAGNLIVAATTVTRYRSGSFAPPNTATIAVTDSTPNFYTSSLGLVRNSASVGGSFQDLPYAINLFWTVVNISGSCSVTATALAPDNFPINDFIGILGGVYEFSLNALDPPDTAVSNTADADSQTAGITPVSGSGELVFGMFFSQKSSYTPGPGFTTGHSINNPIIVGKMFTEYALMQAADIAVTCTASGIRNDAKYAAIGASFKPL